MNEPSSDHLRLHLGEMTANELRTAKAAYRLALTECERYSAADIVEAFIAGIKLAHESVTTRPE